MKKLFFLAIMCLCIAHGHAQKHEISLSYSPLSLYQLDKIIESNPDYSSDYKVLGAFNFDYYYSLNNWLRIGLNVMYDKASGSQPNYYYTPYSSTHPAVATTENKQAYAIAPQVDFEYLRHSKFRLSSGLSLGIYREYVAAEGSKDYKLEGRGYVYHINLIGFRWGEKQGLTGHLGLGHKGLLNLGYFFRF